jgi:O-antigen ligase
MSTVLEAQRPAFRRLKTRTMADAFLPVFMSFMLFMFGTLSWVFKLSKGGNQPILPISPLQAGLPLAAFTAAMLIVQVWHSVIPPFMIKAWSMRLINVGSVLVLIGTTFHIASNSAYRIDAILYFFRWLLPLCCLLFLFLSLHLGGNKDALIYGLLAGCLLSVIAVELDRRGLFTGVQKLGTRSGALLMHPNQYGIVIASMGPFIIYVLHKPGIVPKLIAFASVPVFGLALFESLSKTNIIVFPLVCAATFIAYSLNDTAKLGRAIVIVVISGFIFLFVAGIAMEIVRTVSPKDFQLMTQMTADPTQVKTLLEREDAWHEVLGYIRENPWFGKGPGWAEEHLMYQHAHNMFLQHWIEVGIWGIAGVAILSIGVIVRNFEVLSLALSKRQVIDNEFRLQIAAVISLFAGLIGNSMSSSLNTGSMIPFCIVLAISCLNRRMTPLIKKHLW